MALHAVIVAGHAVLTASKNVTADRSWQLIEFQRGEPPFYIQHVRCAVEEAAADPESLLIFSGGPTRREAGPRTESESYYRVGEHYAWFGHGEIAARVLLEEFARDSFENLLFGLCRFHEFTGEWPERITVVSWAFKEERFGLHREAIGYPAECFRYRGPNDPRDLGQALDSEGRAVEEYRKDPYSSGPRFRAKREARNPFRRQNGYAISCPQVAALLAHKGPEMFTGSLPWRVPVASKAAEHFTNLLT